MGKLLKKIILRLFMLLLVVVLPIATYIFIEDDVQLAWNINSIKEMNKYTIIAEFFPEQEKLSVMESIEYMNKTDKSTDKLFFHLNKILAFNTKLCQDIEEELDYKEESSYKIGKIEYVRIKDKNADFKIIGKDNNVLMVNIDKKLEKDDKVMIEIKYETIISHLAKATNEGTLKYMLSSWYPTAIRYNNGWELESVYKNNELFDDINYFFVDIIVPEGFEVEASGRLIEKIKIKRNQHFRFQDQGTLKFNVNIISTN